MCSEKAQLSKLVSTRFTYLDVAGFGFTSASLSATSSFITFLFSSSEWAVTGEGMLSVSSKALWPQAKVNRGKELLFMNTCVLVFFYSETVQEEPLYV